MNAHEALTRVIAQAPAPPADPGGQGEDFGKSSPVGLLLLVVFAIAVAFLIRSMTKHLKKLPVSFDQQRADTAAPARVQRAEEAAKARAEEDGEPEGGAESSEKAGSGGERGAAASS